MSWLGWKSEGLHLRGFWDESWEEEIVAPSPGGTHCFWPPGAKYLIQERKGWQQGLDRETQLVQIPVKIPLTLPSLTGCSSYKHEAGA